MKNTNTIFVTDTRHVAVGLELKGADNSLRVRQIRILGEIEGESLKLGKQLNAQKIQQRNCEAETLKVFRLITFQVNCLSIFFRDPALTIHFDLSGVWEAYTRRPTTSTNRSC